MLSNNRGVPTFHRYVAIGDSSTEGLVDPDGQGGYRGWADRLAQLIADAQDEPLEYANLAVRSLRLDEIRNRQFDDALALEPDLMTIFGGGNDLIGIGWDLDEMRADLAAMYGEARAHDCTVLTFTFPDPTSINPLGKRVKDRMFRFNDIVRAEAERYGVLVMDFQNYPITEDPRLWFEDRLHGNELGHQRTAAALAWALGVDGADESWAEPLDDEARPPPVPGAAGLRRRLGPPLPRTVAGQGHHRGDPRRGDRSQAAGARRRAPLRRFRARRRHTVRARPVDRRGPYRSSASRSLTY